MNGWCWCLAFRVLSRVSTDAFRLVHFLNPAVQGEEAHDLQFSTQRKGIADELGFQTMARLRLWMEIQGAKKPSLEFGKAF
jgi:hypothetical protein